MNNRLENVRGNRHIKIDIKTNKDNESKACVIITPLMNVTAYSNGTSSYGVDTRNRFKRSRSLVKSGKSPFETFFKTHWNGIIRNCHKKMLERTYKQTLDEGVRRDLTCTLFIYHRYSYN